MLRQTLLLAIMGTQAHADGLRIVTDVPPVQSLVAMATGNTPDVILGAGDDPHHLQLRPGQVRMLAAADVLIWVGPDLTPWLGDEARSVNPDIRLLALGDDKAHGWLDPAVAKSWLDRIAGFVQETGAEGTVGDVAAARETLDRLETEIRDSLADARELRLLADHDAYGAFAERFGLNFVGSISDHDAVEPGAGHLADLHDLAESGMVDCILVEAGGGHAHADDLSVGEIHQTEVDLLGVALEPGAALYPELMRQLATQIADCGHHH